MTSYPEYLNDLTDEFDKDFEREYEKINSDFGDKLMDCFTERLYKCANATSDEINNEFEHIDTLIEGTERFLNLDIPYGLSGCENYVVGVMYAEGADLRITGTEGIGKTILDGLTKVWEVIKKAFKAIKDFFTGNKENKVSGQMERIEKDIKKSIEGSENDSYKIETMVNVKKMSGLTHDAESIEQDMGTIIANVEKSAVKQETDLKTIKNSEEESIKERVKNRSKIIGDFNRLVKDTNALLRKVKTNTDFYKKCIDEYLKNGNLEAKKRFTAINESSHELMGELKVLSKKITAESLNIEKGVSNGESYLKYNGDLTLLTLEYTSINNDYVIATNDNMLGKI